MPYLKNFTGHLLFIVFWENIDTYNYDHNFNLMYTENKSNKMLNTVFKDYQFDECGNWVERKTKSETETKYSIQKIDITYYEPCKKAIIIAMA
ncbi:hypothetical protein MKI79_07870 [Acinetobacter sp. A3.8]|uniref:Uncharacterized protein n=1 Tax=Acinetobacter sedimenti TaxID=2919922 RepID=A0A9X1X2J4_9GAMM|nr:hypothetical protein [Acinetobacter sedimenti]MCJ8146816.1 hypothetical protein [Acinetobacter sedimenti]